MCAKKAKVATHRQNRACHLTSNMAESRHIAWRLAEKICKAIAFYVGKVFSLVFRNLAHASKERINMNQDLVAFASGCSWSFMWHMCFENNTGRKWSHKYVLRNKLWSTRTPWHIITMWERRALQKMFNIYDVNDWPILLLPGTTNHIGPLVTSILWHPSTNRPVKS